MVNILSKLFGKRTSRVDAFKAGKFFCESCGARQDLAKNTPMTLSVCPRCKERNFVPAQVSDFWLVAPLGGGGMGSVYKAYHGDFNDEVFAIKILLGDRKTDPSCREGLLREIRTMKSIGHHPAIASIVSTEHDSNELFLATRFIEGERLDRRIGRLGRLPEREALLLGLRLLSAIAHIYNNGYLFRDMKPQNVIISPVGAFLFDFGICLRYEEVINNPGENVDGSALYYPPERLSEMGERANSEIYSLGMVLYHALTGSPYFTAKDIETMTTLNVRKSRLKNLSDKAKYLEKDTRRVLEKMINRKQDERYQSFIEVEHVLMKLLLKRTWGDPS